MLVMDRKIVTMGKALQKKDLSLLQSIIVLVFLASLHIQH